MARRSKRSSDHSRPPTVPGRKAGNRQLQIQTFDIGPLPLIQRFLERLRLEDLFRQFLPADDPRTEFPTARALLVLVRNVLVSREPIYGIPEWAARYAPDTLDLFCHQLDLLHDDRLGRCLDRLFESCGPDLLLAVTRQAIAEFGLRLDELHNDSTTISFFGAYTDADREGTQRGRPTHAITWGHSKDHRPDLKQLLYTLTVTDDGAVPVYFTSASGNVVDDTTHRQTWDLLCELVGRADFLYVADCKLASRENLRHLAARGGRFVTVLPRTRKEDEEFRRRLRESPQTLDWERLLEVRDEDGQTQDQLSGLREELLSGDGFRLLWYRSLAKVERDQSARAERLQRALAELGELRERLRKPRTRFRKRTQVEQAVAKIRQRHEQGDWLVVELVVREDETFRQAKRGRPGPDTQFVRQVRSRFDLTWRLDAEALAIAEREDGVFPLLTNDRQLSALEVLQAYRRQPRIEKRFSQFKTDFAVAPVFLKNVARIQGLLAVYYLVLLIQALLERQLRQALEKSGRRTLPLYPESRPCARPTARRVFDVLETVQRHVVMLPDGRQEFLVTELTPLQREILELLEIDPDTYGR
jgi:transposase